MQLHNQPVVYIIFPTPAEKFSKCISDVSISNGIAWNPSWTKMYFVDSYPKKIYSLDYDEEAGMITNQQVSINYTIDGNLGIPDGMCTDGEGKLWVASFKFSGRTGYVTRWDPDSGKKLAQIPIPTSQVTSCCFGGSDYSTLFVTTAFYHLPDRELEKCPRAGDIFTVTDTGVKGLPGNRYNDTRNSRL